MARRLVAEPEVPLRKSAQVRVIYADTDKMGVVYHATYLRFLEHARVEFIRSLGFAYADMEGLGFGLPVIDLAVTYLQPAEYDDLLSVYVGLAKLTPARVNFVYELRLEPGDRRGFFDRATSSPGLHGPEPLVLLRAQTFHGCMDMHDRRATRLPDPVYVLLERAAAGELPPEPA
jgi:acyl-CoA thioester hydrolase